MSLFDGNLTPPKSWTFWAILIERFLWYIFSLNITPKCYEKIIFICQNIGLKTLKLDVSLFSRFYVSSRTWLSSSTLEDKFASLFRGILTSCSYICLWLSIVWIHNRDHSWINIIRIKVTCRSSYSASRGSWLGLPKSILILMGVSIGSE